MGRQVSSTDVSAALKNIGPSRSPMKRNSLGLRNTETQFRELLKSCLLGVLLHPESLFHLKELHRNTLLRTLAEVVASVEQLILALEAVSRAKIPAASWTALQKTKSSLEKVGDTSSPLSLEMAQSQVLEAAAVLKKNFMGDVPTAEEGRKIISAEVAVLRVKAQVLLEGFGHLASTTGADISAIKAALLPGMAADLAEQVGETIKAVDDETILQKPGARVAELVAVPAVIKAVTQARDPMKPIVQPKDGSLEEQGPFPEGSSLELQAVAPVVPPTVTATRTPGAFGASDDFKYTPNDAAERTISLVGAGQMRIVSDPLGDPTYTITANQILLDYTVATYPLPLATGLRTQTDVKNDLETSAAARGLDLTVEIEGKRLYLVSTNNITLVTNALIPLETALLTGDLSGSFPMAIAGLDLVVTADLLGLTGSLTHTFGAGPFNDMQDVIDDLEADAPFAADMVFSDESDKLKILYSRLGYTFMQVTATPGPLSFDTAEISNGTDYSDVSAAEELGFTAMQGSELLYTAQQIVDLIELEEGTSPEVTARADLRSLVEGEGTLSTAGPYVRLTDENQDFTDLGIAVGDYCNTPKRLLVIAVIGTTWLDLETEDVALGVNTTYEITSERVEITSTDTSLASALVIGSGTANASMGILPGSPSAPVPEYKVVGTLEGENASRTVDNAVLGIPETVEVDMTNSVVTSVSLKKFRALQSSLRSVTGHAYYKYLREYRELLENVVEASRLTGLKSGRVQQAQKQLVSLLYLLDSVSPNSTAVLASLQRVGVLPPAVPTARMRSALLAYTPPVAAADAGVATDLLRSLREHGYDRAAKFALETRFVELLDMTGETSSTAGSLTAALSLVGSRIKSKDRR